MIKFGALYPWSDGIRFDMDYYPQKHMPAVQISEVLPDSQD